MRYRKRKGFILIPIILVITFVSAICARKKLDKGFEAYLSRKGEIYQRVRAYYEGN